MRFLLLCPAALLLLAYVAERVVADPESVTPKSDSIDEGLLLAKERSLIGASAPGNLLGGGGKSDSIDDTPPPANRIEGVSVGKGERSLSGASAPGHLLGGGGKGDSIDDTPPPANRIPGVPVGKGGRSLGGGGKGDSIDDSPDSAPESGKDDTVVVVVTKDAPSDVNETSTEEVKELRKQLADEQAEAESLTLRILNLKREVRKARAERFRLFRGKTTLYDQLNTVNRKLAVEEMRLSSARLNQEKCQKLGGDLNGSEIAKLVEEETRKQVEERQAAINFAQQLKYRRLLDDLRKRIGKEVIKEAFGRLEKTTTRRPKNYTLFPLKN